MQVCIKIYAADNEREFQKFYAVTLSISRRRYPLKKVLIGRYPLLWSKYTIVAK